MSGHVVCVVCGIERFVADDECVMRISCAEVLREAMIGRVAAMEQENRRLREALECLRKESGCFCEPAFDNHGEPWHQSRCKAASDALEREAEVDT